MGLLELITEWSANWQLLLHLAASGCKGEWLGGSSCCIWLHCLPPVNMIGLNFSTASFVDVSGVQVKVTHIFCSVMLSIGMFHMPAAELWNRCLKLPWTWAHLPASASGASAEGKTCPCTLCCSGAVCWGRLAGDDWIGWREA
eukprot:1158003-Pelagomonas_calceolata.AAC.3